MSVKRNYKTRAELQIEIDRAQDEIKAHGKASDDFDETLVGLFEIAAAAGELFDRSKDIEQKRLLMSFIFESLQMNEGTIFYKLNFPFSEMEDSANSGGNHSEPAQNKALSPKISEFKISKNQPVRTDKNEEKSKAYDAKSQACSNWLPNSSNVRTVIDLRPYLEKRAEILALREQLAYVKQHLAA